MRGRILVLHFEFLNSYRNKNLGYFIQFCISKGFQVDFLTLTRNAEEYDGKFGPEFRLRVVDSHAIDSFKMFRYLSVCAKEYEFIWLYPLCSRLFWIVAFMRVCGVKPILKLDSINLVRGDESSLRRIAKTIRVNFIYLVAYRIIFESEGLKKGFIGTQKFRRYTLGLSKSNLTSIKNLNAVVIREKRIACPGRIVRAKGQDRLIEAFIKLKKTRRISDEWCLFVFGKVVDQIFNKELHDTVSRAGMETEIFFEKEKFGEDYYREIFKSNLIVLPSRGEGLPNILADAYFCKRLFLTTNVAKCEELIKDPVFFCGNDSDSICVSIEKIILDLEGYYSRFDKIYPKSGFIDADSFFSELISGTND